MKLFSFSRLSLFQTCPKRFFYRYVLGKSEPVTKPLALGTAVHKALELVVNGASMEEAIKKGYIECDFHEEVSPIEIRELVERAPLGNLKGETELYFCIPLFPEEKHSPKLQGFIDLIAGNKIVDFKTNRKMYHVTDNYQMGLYAWALSKLRGYSQVRTSLIFLRHRKESSVLFKEGGMNEAISWAKGIVIEINSKLELYEFFPDKQNELFPYKPSAACEYCPFAIDCYIENRL